MSVQDFFEHTVGENRLWFDYYGSSIDNGLCIERVSQYISEEGWDDEYDPVSDDVVLPDCIDGCPIVEIEEDAFSTVPGIKSLRLPDRIQIVRKNGLGGLNHKGIQHIDRSAFFGCALTDFVIRGDPPRISSIKAIVDGSQRCPAENFAMLTDIPYRYLNKDGL